MPEKVPDHLHRHALIQQMLGRCVAQGMCTSSAGDDTYSGETITNDLAKGLSADWSDRRMGGEEEAAAETAWPGFPYVAQNGIADVQ